MFGKLTIITCIILACVCLLAGCTTGDCIARVQLGPLGLQLDVQCQGKNPPPIEADETANPEQTP